ncbi:MAG: hypothetical protein WCQ54_03555 [Clostridiaceae bacterium]
MKDFIDFMNQVKAEKELKENTINCVETNINNNLNKKSNEKIKKEKFKMKKFLTAASTVAACAVFALIGNFYYNTPVEYLSVDINPSVEMGINAFNKVVCIEGINNDGKALLKDKKLLKMTVEDTVEALVKEAEKEGFIADDGSTVIAVTAVSDNEEKAVQLKEKAYNRIQQEIKAGKVKAIAYGDYSNLELRTEAQKVNMSAGKYKLVSALKTLDPNIDIEQFRYTKITDIISEVNDLLTSDTSGKVQTKEFERVASMVRTAAQNINNITQTQVGTQTQTQTQAGTQTQTKTQAGTQTQTQTQAGTQTQTQTQAGTQTQTKTQAGTQTQTQTQAGAQTQTQTQAGTQTQTQTQAGTQTQNQTQTEQTETQTQQDDTSQSTSQQSQVKAGQN